MGGRSSMELVHRYVVVVEHVTLFGYQNTGAKQGQLPEQEIYIYIYIYLLYVDTLMIPKVLYPHHACYCKQGVPLSITDDWPSPISRNYETCLEA